MKSSRRRPLADPLRVCACGAPAAFGRTICRTCIAEQAKKQREAQHAQGNCRCGQPLEKDRKRCADCLKALRDDAAARTAARIEKKQCVHCTKRAKKGHILCRTHLKSLRAYNKIYRRRLKEQHQHYAV